MSDRRPFIVMEVDGILRKPVGGQVNEEGLRLFRALSGTYQVILVTWEAPSHHFEEWLYKENIGPYADLIHAGEIRQNVTDTTWTNRLRYLQMRGYAIEFCVVNDPESAMDVLSRGVSCLMYSQPAYALPEWLPGSQKGDLGWSSLVGKVEADALARREDKRMEGNIE